LLKELDFLNIYNIEWDSLFGLGRNYVLFVYVILNSVNFVFRFVKKKIPWWQTVSQRFMLLFQCILNMTLKYTWKITPIDLWFDCYQMNHSWTLKALTAGCHTQINFLVSKWLTP
jgi:hypothetical protein